MSLVNYSLNVAHLLERPGPYVPCHKCGLGLMDDDQMYVLVRNDEPQRPLCEGCVEMLFGSVANYGERYADADVNAMLGTLDADDGRLRDLVML